MRKIGFVCAGLGAAIALLLGFLRSTVWFAEEQARMMSEAVEFIVSFFWAAAALCVVGLILIVTSTYHHDEEATFEDYLPNAGENGEELVWICPVCGTENPDDAEFCTGCGYQDGTDPNAAYDSGNWQCPRCGCVWSDSASVCTNCGYRRFD